MIPSILSVLTNFIVAIISALGYLGVFLLMAVQTIAIPIPSEVIIPFAGFLAGTGRFSLWLVALFGALGSSLGASIAYWIGYKGGRPLVEKYGRAILISPNDLDLTERFFASRGTWAVFLGQLLPVVRSFICFPAGISRQPLKKFLGSVFVGSYIWCLALAYVGEKLGQNWTSLHDRFKSLDTIIVGLIIIGAVWWVWRHVRNRKSI